MKRIHCFFVLWLCLLCVCSGNRQVTKQLNRAEVLLEAVHPTTHGHCWTASTRQTGGATAYWPAGICK